MFFLHRNKSISRVINRWCQEKTLDINSGINDYVTSNNWKILKLGKSTFSGFYNTFRESNLFDDHAFFLVIIAMWFFFSPILRHRLLEVRAKNLFWPNWSQCCKTFKIEEASFLIRALLLKFLLRWRPDGRVLNQRDP